MVSQGQGNPLATAGPDGSRLVAGMLIAAVMAFAYAMVWTVSFPGLPMVGVGLIGISFLVASALWLVLGWRLNHAQRLGAGITSAVLFLATVVVAATGLPLQARFSASVADLDAAVAAAEQHPSAAVGVDGDDERFPGHCPSVAGLFAIAECHRFDDGFIFVETWNPLTDTSGFLYLPDGPAGYSPQDLRHLSGPWYSWTCNC